MDLTKNLLGKPAIFSVLSFFSSLNKNKEFVSSS
jgi:hypothetical protein